MVLSLPRDKLLDWSFLPKVCIYFSNNFFLGYVNPLNTTLSFDVTLYSPVASSTGPLYTNTTRFQNNVSFVLN